MNRELACKLAEGNTLYEKCLSANAIFKSNGGDWNKPFANSDLAAIRLTEFLIDNTSQRERDLIVTYELLERCHRELHISVQVLREYLSPKSESDVCRLVESMKRLGIPHFLTEGLSEDIIARYCS